MKKLEAAQIFIKTIKIEVDPWYKDNIFAKQTFPISKTLKYMVGNTNFEENYEIVEKQEKNENLGSGSKRSPIVKNSQFGGNVIIFFEKKREILCYLDK